MNTVAKAGKTRTGLREHGCPVPDYLHLPDLAMLWQCQDCREFWQLVADRRAPGSPLEFVWVRDPIQPDAAPEQRRDGAAIYADGS